MANKDFQSGLRPYTEGGTARPRLTEYPVGASVTIFAGGPVKRLAAGTVDADDIETTNDDTIGVAAHYVATAAGETATVLVWDDPDQLFVIQCTEALSQLDIGINLAFDAAPGPEEGDAFTRQSKCVATDAGKATTANKLRLIGLAKRIDNEWGANQDIVVKFNVAEHAYSSLTGI